MSTSSSAIVAAHVTPEAAAAVLAVEGHHLGRSPGTFAQRLISLVKAADQANRAWLATRFPDYVEATLLAQTSDGLDQLVRIVTANLDRTEDPDGDLNAARCGAVNPVGPIVLPGDYCRYLVGHVGPRHSWSVDL